MKIYGKVEVQFHSFLISALNGVSRQPNVSATKIREEFSLLTE